MPDYEIEDEPKFPEAYPVERMMDMPTIPVRYGQFPSSTRYPRQAEGNLAVPSGTQALYDKQGRDIGIAHAVLGEDAPAAASGDTLPLGDMLKVKGPLGLPWAFWLVAGAALLGYWIAKSKFE